MSNQKSIIGCGYIPLEMQAVCLKTNMNTNLGDIVYKIITAPYERVFVRKNLFDLTPKECKRMAVDVVDEYTGLTYAVEYEPANLVHPTSESKTDQPGEPVDFATRAGQIAEELKSMFNSAGEGISDKCGVAFFAVSDDGNDKTSTCVGFLGGRGGRVSEAIGVFQEPPSPRNREMCLDRGYVSPDIRRRQQEEITNFHFYNNGKNKS